MLSLKLSAESARLLERVAQQERTTVSEVVRASLSREPDFELEPLAAGPELVRVRFDSADLDWFRNEADELGLSASEYVRLSLASYLAEEDEPDKDGGARVDDHDQEDEDDSLAHTMARAAIIKTADLIDARRARRVPPEAAPPFRLEPCGHPAPDAQTWSPGSLAYCPACGQARALVHLSASGA
jgi:hypothetical protein